LFLGLVPLVLVDLRHHILHNFHFVCMFSFLASWCFCVLPVLLLWALHVLVDFYELFLDAFVLWWRFALPIYFLFFLSLLGIFFGKLGYFSRGVIFL